MVVMVCVRIWRGFGFRIRADGGGGGEGRKGIVELGGIVS